MSIASRAKKQEKGINSLKLKARILEKGVFQEEVAKILNLSTSRFNQKINGRGEFTHKEMEAIILYLNIQPDDIMDIFFPVVCEKRKQTKRL